MLRFLILLALLCGSAFTEEPGTENSKQRKRGILNGGWVGIPSLPGYGHGHPWADNSNPWKGLKITSDLHHPNHGGWSYGGGDKDYSHKHALGIHGHPEIAHIKPPPIYITKHVVVEKPVPVPQPVYIEKPYHVPIEKIVHVPVETVVHKTVPVPVPVPQAVPYPVDRAVPIPVKHPVPVPVQQPYPIPVKHAVPYPVPVPYPIPTYPGPFLHHGGGADYYPGHHGLLAHGGHGGHGYYGGLGHLALTQGHGFGHGGHGYGIGHALGQVHGFGQGHDIGNAHFHDHHGYGYHHHHDQYGGHGEISKSKRKAKSD